MPNPNCVLVTNPNFDLATSYLSAWSDSICEEAKARNMQVHELRENATRGALKERIEKYNPALIAFNGHGSPDCVTGGNREVLVKVGENENILDSTIVHSLSCSSASILGPKSVKAGAKAFIGYNQDFVPAA